MSFRRGIKVLPLRPLLQQNEPPRKPTLIRVKEKHSWKTVLID